MKTYSRRQFVAATAAAGAAMTLSKPAIAQQYPAQDIHFVCGFPPGSGGDVIVRYFAERVRPMTGKNIIVENRAGAGGNIAIEYVARAKPDGYTILLHGGNAIAGMMSLLKNPPIDTAKTMQLAATINSRRSCSSSMSKTPYKTSTNSPKPCSPRARRRATRPTPSTRP